MFNLSAALAAVAATAATVSFSVPAEAAEPGVRTRLVSYADLDLGREADRTVLDGRIRRAAAFVCGPMGRELSPMLQVMACRTDAVADAEARMAIVVAQAQTGTELAQAGGSLTVAAR